MKCGLVAVAGRPNVGKSTLVNALAGEKVAITSTVPNTTRRRIFGVVNGDDWQLVLVDLPGFQRPMDPLTERMQRTVDSSFEDVDAVSSSSSARDWSGPATGSSRDACSSSAFPVYHRGSTRSTGSSTVMSPRR